MIGRLPLNCRRRNPAEGTGILPPGHAVLGVRFSPLLTKEGLGEDDSRRRKPSRTVPTPSATRMRVLRPSVRGSASVSLATVFALGLFLAPPPSHAQGTPKPPPKPIFGQVIPQITGENGYEELVLAADVLAASPVYAEAQKSDPPLAVKRAILKDRYIARALALVQVAVRKPVLSPRSKLTYSTALPEVQRFRDLARVLAIQQYVFLADGRVPEAIGNARVALQFSDVIQQDTLIQGLVGLATRRLTLAPLVEHLDQLSARDCEVVYRLALQSLAAPSTQDRIFAGDARWSREGLTDFRNALKEKGPAAFGGLFTADDENGQRVAQSFPNTPDEIDRTIAQAEMHMARYYEQIALQLKRPPWERKFPEPAHNGDPAVMLASSLIPSFARVDAAYTRELARLRMLACEVAIRRYRWEHDRLPADLAILRLGGLAIDPFTGLPLEYTVKGRTFILRSAGPLSENNPNAVNGRVPVSVGP